MSKVGNFDSIREQVREISRISAAVPEEFRLKCFELLMTHLLKSPGGVPLELASRVALPGSPTPTPSEPIKSTAGYSGAPPMNSLLTAFVRKIGVSNEQFRRVVGYVHGNVVFVREPAGDRGAPAQLEWALLVALKSGIVKGSFLVDPEEVRLVCQEKGVFDRRTFSTVFRRYAEMFRAPPEPGGKPQPLSSKGIAALGTLVKELVDEA